MRIAHAICSTIAKNVQTIHDINRRYATPRMKMSGPVRIALLTLRIYLLVLVALLGYKFYTVLAK
jgi:hypothetical protein